MIKKLKLVILTFSSLKGQILKNSLTNTLLFLSEFYVINSNSIYSPVS